jgi:TetR/AcrR family transcriptional regulator, regulator of cefoperazone and chloramphenicol sensitivity
MRTHEQAVETRQRLLEAAGEVFAERGFRNATIREICEHAGANVAAINYHFGDKESLYAEVINEWARVATQKYPPTLGLGDNPTPEERLHAFVRSFLHRIADKGRPAWHGKLIAREMADPTAALDQLIDENFRPMNQQLESIIRSILGVIATNDQVRLYSASVMGQCLHYHFARPVIERQDPQQKFEPEDIEHLANHITEFSLNALRAARHPVQDGGNL